MNVSRASYDARAPSTLRSTRLVHVLRNGMPLRAPARSKLFTQRDGILPDSHKILQSSYSRAGTISPTLSQLRSLKHSYCTHRHVDTAPESGFVPAAFHQYATPRKFATLLSS